jgi:hypothetical protein
MAIESGPPERLPLTRRQRAAVVASLGLVIALWSASPQEFIFQVVLWVLFGYWPAFITGMAMACCAGTAPVERPAGLRSPALIAAVVAIVAGLAGHRAAAHQAHQTMPMYFSVSYAAVMGMVPLLVAAAARVGFLLTGLRPLAVLYAVVTVLLLAYPIMWAGYDGIRRDWP